MSLEHEPEWSRDEDFLIVIGSGRCSEDVIRRQGPKAIYIRFDIASRISKGKSHITEWSSCIAFGDLAEQFGDVLKKGERIRFEGNLETQAYTAKDGTEKKVKKILLTKIFRLQHSPLVEDDVPF